VTSELRAQVRLAIPLAAQQLGFQLMGLVDAAMLGRYDDTALAATCCSRSRRSGSAS
jgi:Na+-driven multidrug efflux pump